MEKERKVSGNLRYYLKLALAGEYADPLVIIVGDDDVATGVHSYSRWSLQLARRSSTYPKTSLKLTLIGENLLEGNL